MSPKQALIQSARVRLVPVEVDAMLPAFYRWANNPDTRHLIGDAAYPRSLAAVRGWLEGYREVTFERAFFAILAPGRDEPVGWIRLSGASPEHRWCSVTISIGDPEYRGRGYGTEAIRLACRFAFEEMGLERVFLDTFDFNTRAIRAYEKVGFVQEGRLRRHAYLGGTYYDVIAMGLLREEFIDGGAGGG